MAWLEAASFSVWVRESVVGFPLTISLHALGMAFLVGVHFALDLRIIGFAPKLPVHLIIRFYPLMWASFIVALLSGLTLLLAYPAKRLNQLCFLFKDAVNCSGLYCWKVFDAKSSQARIRNFKKP